MTHLSNEEWRMYVTNVLPQGRRAGVEDHLYSCDVCLELYLQAVDEIETALPDVREMENITDQVMIKIHDLKVGESQKQFDKAKPKQKKNGVPFYQTSIFHYTLAAAATILLMMTGVFQNLANYTDSVQQSSSFQKNHSSVTANIVNKTFSWLDSFETNHKEANSK